MKKYKFQSKIVLCVGIIICNMLLIGRCFAYNKEMMEGESDKKDIVLIKGREEFILDPGQTAQAEIIFANRLGETRQFKVEVEDYIGTTDPDQATIFINDEDNPYSLKKYITPEVYEFELQNMEQIYLPVTISIPEGAKPGGLYGSVAISPISKGKSLSPTADNSEDLEKHVDFIPRLAFMLLIKVNGEVNEDGKLQSFTVGKKFYEKGPIDFKILFENNSNVHLDPYGSLKIKNMLGKTVSAFNIKPFFTLPESVKKETLDFNRKILFGKYKAELKLNRGYKEKDDIIDIATVEFWVLPWKFIVIGLIVIIALIWGIASIISKYKVIKK